MSESTTPTTGKDAVFHDPHPGAPRQHRKMVYIVSAVILVGLAVWGVIAFDGMRESKAAKQKADRLIAELKDAGLPAPKRETLVDTFGDDGGMVCSDPGSALSQARYKGGWYNGASGPGNRPVIGDKDLVQGEALVISVYCPSELGAFTKRIKEMKFEDTVK